jgi:hypothetical protein
VPFPEETSWIERLKQTYQVSDHTFVFCSELHEHTVAQLIELDLPNLSLFICGVIDHKFVHTKVYPWMDWFITTAHFYKHQQPTLLNEKLLPQKLKPKLWDILLGAQRGHRDFVYNYINNSSVKEQAIMTYFRSIHHALGDNEQFALELEGTAFIPNRKLTHSIDAVLYYGKERSLSQIVPIDVYNQTYYSIVAETNYFNHFNFYTEKVVKPMMAGRLFVAIAGRYYLKNLRGFGFKTFGDVINEDYDLEPNSYRRWEMALQQVEYLSSQDPEVITSKIENIVAHNRQLIMEKDWYKETSEIIKSIISF